MNIMYVIETFFGILALVAGEVHNLVVDIYRCMVCIISAPALFRYLRTLPFVISVKRSSSSLALKLLLVVTWLMRAP